MTVRAIAKASTYGEHREWQVNPEFLTKLKHYIMDNDKGYGEYAYEELLDEIICALSENGFLILATTGASKL